MSEIILEVSQRYSHRGRGIRHRPNTKRQWYVFFLDNDMNFRTKRINVLQVPYYKSKICKRIRCTCVECGHECLVYAKNLSQAHATQCPNGCEIPSLMTGEDMIESLNVIDSDLS